MPGLAAVDVLVSADRARLGSDSECSRVNSGFVSTKALRRTTEVALQAPRSLPVRRPQEPDERIERRPVPVRLSLSRVGVLV